MSKFLTSQPGKQTITISFSEKKKKHSQNVGEKLFPDPFLKIKFKHISE